jgi:hypothetical protein
MRAIPTSCLVIHQRYGKGNGAVFQVLKHIYIALYKIRLGEYGDIRLRLEIGQCFQGRSCQATLCFRWLVSISHRTEKEPAQRATVPFQLMGQDFWEIYLGCHVLAPMHRFPAKPQDGLGVTVAAGVSTAGVGVEAVIVPWNSRFYQRVLTCCLAQTLILPLACWHFLTTLRPRLWLLAS